MEWKNQRPDNGSTLPLRGLGIGRAVSRQWMIDFEVALQKATDLTLHAQKIPGVAYATSDDLAAIGPEHGGLSDDNDQEYAVHHLGALLTMLCADGTLDVDRSMRPVSVSLRSIKTRRRRSEWIFALVEDIPIVSPHYPGGWLIDGEESAIRRSLHLPDNEPYPYPTHATPWHIIGIGTLQASSHQLSNSFQKVVRESLPKQVELSPVGIIQR